MGPLDGVKIIEIAGIGPMPFAAMLLADMGADIIRVDRPVADGPGVALPHRLDVVNRGRRSIAVNLKSPEGVGVVLSLAKNADALLEGFRPGVAERLGIGPEDCRTVNPRLVYGRVTGWGQDGPMASVAGHDINYIALSGVLHTIGPKGGKPIPPLNLIGDYGGGGMFLAFGVVCGILEAQKSGEGQVVDAAMVEGSAFLANKLLGFRASNMWSDERGSNIMDGGSHFYNTYETQDGKYIAVGAVESQFYARLIELVGLDAAEFTEQMDPSRWSERTEKMAAVFKTKTRDEWAELLEHEEACVTPVLTLSESPQHPQMKARGVFTERDGVQQVAPTPRFSRTAPELRLPPPKPGEHTDTVLEECGFSAVEIEELRGRGAIV